MRKLSSIFLALALLVSVLQFSIVQALALESTDTNLVEVDTEKKIVYVYDRKTTVADLKKVLGSEIVYANLAGETGEDTELVLNGTITAADGTYQVSMTKELLRMDFEEEGHKMPIAGYNGQREAGIEGKDEKDFVWTISAEQAPEGLKEWYDATGADTGRITTYELKVMIPSMYTEEQLNEIEKLNICIKTKSDQQWDIQPNFLPGGQANIPGRGVIDDIELDTWHSLAVSFLPTDIEAKKAEAYFYLDGQPISMVSLTNYTAVESVKIGIQGKSGQPVKLFLDDYLVYNGFYGAGGPVSLDESVVEIDGKTVYVYDRELTKTELFTKINANGATLRYIREDGSVVEDDETIVGGWLEVGGERYQVQMTKELVSVDFKKESQTLMGFDGLTSDRQGGLAGRAEDDYAQAVSTVSGSGAAVRTFLNSGSPSRKIITYEMNMLIPERFQNQSNVVDNINFIIKTDSDDAWRLQTKLLGTGQASVPGESSILDIALGQWHHVAVTIKPLADGSAEFYSYLDGTQVGADLLKNYNGIADTRLEITFPTGGTGIVAFDDYRVYYGSYISKESTLSSQDYRIEIAGTNVYVYSLEMTKKELLEKIYAPDAVLNYYNEDGEVAGETDLVKNGTLMVDDKAYAIRMKKEIHSDDYNRELAENTAPSKIQGINKVERAHQSYVQSGIAGRGQEDSSFIIETNDFTGPSEQRNPSLQVWEALEGVVTVQVAVYLEGQYATATLAVPCVGTTGTIWNGQITMNSEGTVKAEGFSTQIDPGGWHVMAITTDTQQKTFTYYFDGVRLGSKNVDTIQTTRNFNVEVIYPEDASEDKKYSGKLAVDSFALYYGAYDPTNDLITTCPLSGDVTISDKERVIGIKTDYTAAEFKALFSPDSGIVLYDDASMTSQVGVNNFGVWGEGEYALFKSPSGDRIQGYTIVMLGDTVKVEKPVITMENEIVSATATVTAANLEGSTVTLVLASYDVNGTLNAVTFVEEKVEIKGKILATIDVVPAGKSFKAFVLNNLNGLYPLGEVGVYSIQ